MKSWRLFAGCLFLLCLPVGAEDGSIPARAEDLRFPISYWVPPNAADYRWDFSIGAPIFFSRSTFTGRMTVQAIVLTRDAESPLTAFVMGRVMTERGPAGSSMLEFRKALADLGARMNVRAGFGTLSLVLTAPRDRFGKAFRLFLQTLKEPRFPPEVLATVRDKILRSWERDMERPGASERATFLRAAAKTGSGLVTASDLARIAPEDLAAFHKKFVGLKRITFALSGPAREEEMRPLFRKCLEGMGPGDLGPGPGTGKKPERGQGIFVIDTGARLATGLAGYPMFPEGEEEGPAFQVAFQILAARVRMRVHAAEPGATSPSATLIRDPAGFSHACFSFRLWPREAATALKTIEEEGENLGRTLVPAGEFQDAVDRLKRSTMTRFQSSRGKVTTLALLECLRGPARKTAGAYGGLLQVSRSKVLETAKKYLVADRFLAVFSGSFDKIKEEMEYAGLRREGVWIHRTKEFSLLRNR